MTSDMTLTERLMRQKNTILQRQLEVKLKILEIEHKTTQKEILESQRDCSLFLANLSHTWVGLERYSQPDTRAMAKDAKLKDRRVSTMTNGVSDNDNVSSPTEESVFSVQQTRNNMSYSGYSFPENRRGSDMNCLDVLDDILRSHGRGQQTQQRRRKLGIVVVPTGISLNADSEDGAGYNTNTNAVSRDRLLSSAPQANRRVTLISDNHLLQSRHQTSSPAGDNKVISKTHNSPVNGRLHLKQTVSEEHLMRPRTRHNMLSKNKLIRPHTAVMMRSDSMDMSWRQRRSFITDPLTPLPGEECKRKRPKTAPTKYELYGRSPAIARKTVAGIMAEMNSRCAETRGHIKHSQDLKKIVKKLHGPEINTEDVIDD